MDQDWLEEAEDNDSDRAPDDRDDDCYEGPSDLFDNE